MKNQPVSSLELEVGKKYLLRTYDRNGDEKDESYWIRATWNGQSLVDNDGCTWNEWLYPSYRDIFKAE